MKYEAHDYQKYATEFILTHPTAAVLLEMGLGKSVITLTAIQELIDTIEVSKVLVVAPKKVAESTWVQEAASWEHLRDLRVISVHGSKAVSYTHLTLPTILEV